MYIVKLQIGRASRGMSLTSHRVLPLAKLSNWLLRSRYHGQRGKVVKHGFVIIVVNKLENLHTLTA